MKTQLSKLLIFSLFVIALGSCKKDAEMPNGEFVNLKTSEATEITAVSAVVSAVAGADCTERGVCWGKAPNPTIDDFHVANGSGKGEYTCTLTDLEPDQKYYFRAYGYDGKRYVYAQDEKNFTTKDGLVTLTTADATGLGSTYATLGGVVNDDGMPILERGVCYGLEPGTSIDGPCMTSTDSTNTFAVALTGLENGALYYYKAYVKPLLGSVVYGDELTFTTLDGRPVVSTGDITEITATSATCSGEVTDEGHASVLERGICWSKEENPTLEDIPHMASGSGMGGFDVELTGLEPNTTYHVWAYAKSVLGTRYGNEKTFTTEDGLPCVTTGNVSDVTSTSATCSGNVTDDGGFAVTERGICWSTTPNPTLENAQHVAAGSGTGGFSATLTGLTEYTKYYVRAYATNSQGTSYGSNVSFTPGYLDFTANGVSFTMIPVEGGTFTMGATAEQGSDAGDNEYPTHSVTLSSYYMGETEVTQALWQAVMGSNPSYNTGDSQRPVEQVSWDDCQTFITKLNQQCAGQLNGRQFRLPTEAEWEYAARGGNKSYGYKYSGSNTLGNVAWYTGTTNNSSTKPVGTKQANELGLYDMSGNVEEWCSDRYGDYSNSAQTDPTGPATGYLRVFRGGGWSDYARFCRVSGRNSGSTGSSYSFLGLRLSLR